MGLGGKGLPYYFAYARLLSFDTRPHLDALPVECVLPGWTRQPAAGLLVAVMVQGHAAQWELGKHYITHAVCRT
jgi:hypothetical protein